MSNSGFSALYFLSFTSAAHGEVAGGLMASLGSADYKSETGSITEATAFLKDNPSPRVLLVELSPQGEPAAQLDQLADVVNPATKVIVLGTTDTLSFYHWLMELGIHEYLLAPLTANKLGAALEKGNIAQIPAVSTAVPLTKMVGVIGARGGVGTTTIATNLAALFAEEYSVNTGLIDLDPYFGSVALGLDLEPGRGMRDALEKPERIDGLFLDRVMIRPQPNLSIMSAEEPLHEIALPHASTGPMLFAALASKFNVIVADVPRQMNPLTRHVLAHADMLVIVAEPQLMDLRDALRIRDYVVEQLKRPAPLLLINRDGIGGERSQLSIHDLTKHYGAAPVGTIPLLPEAFGASAEGTLLIRQPKLAQALAPLHTLISRVGDFAATSSSVAEKKTGLFSRLKPKGKI